MLIEFLHFWFICFVLVVVVAVMTALIVTFVLPLIILIEGGHGFWACLYFIFAFPATVALMAVFVKHLS